MDFELTPELAELQRTVRRLAQDKVAPRAREIDRTGEYPQDLFEVFRDAGLLGLCIPEAYGGSGAGILGLTIAIEEVAKHSNTAALMLLLTRLPTGPVMIAGSEEQKQRYLPGIAAGISRAAFGLSEPQAGSDVAGMRTRAVPDPDRPGGWILSGTKCWMSGVREADWYTVFAKTGDPASRAHDAITAFIVERSWPGVSVGRTDRKMGVRGVDTGELLLDEVRVPPENVIGEVGGFRLAMLGLNAMRPIVAARGIGLAEGALMYATRYVKDPVGDREVRRRDRGGSPPDLPGGLAGRPRQVHEGVGAVPLHGQVPRHRARRPGLGARGPAARRSRLHGGPPHRAVVPGRPAAHHRGGHQPGPAGPHRPGGPGRRPLVGLIRRRPKGPVQ
ncbi:acyl-CoA dehydrogenase family protein [Aciditerrimonas ferrireducens]|uniref:acyl-CoA dehydrogenase family protein n=1 Tax=Aciditerrimonas ferrireducens TaxID=667306 RepID=UPI00200693FD|nr:acyl-CoA dehydrogenase family protein [Aciditerrimonas ferrireducens]MCK4177326.1 acyl-CoA dehydrogenase family protein [Aciditerrimonas ferrireducens]